MANKSVIILVPGAFHRPSAWTAVAKPLREKGFTVLTPPLTTCGDLSNKTPESPEWKEIAGKDATDDAKMLHEVLVPLLDEGQEAVIVGHSYGSIVATLAVEGQTVAERTAKGHKGGLKALIIVAGFAYPARGKGIMGDESEPPVMPYHILDNDILHLQESAKPIWYSDLSSEGQDAAWADLYKAHSRKSFLLFPQFIAADVKIPKVWVYTEEDQAIVPQFQDMSIQVGGFQDVRKLPSGHTPALSMPEKLLEIIADVALGSSDAR